MNSPITRQELQLQLQQTINTILSKTMSRDEFNNITLRLSSKQDLQSCVENARQKILEKVIYPINEQQLLNQQLVTHLDNLGKILAQLDQKIDNLQKSINTVQNETETVMRFEQSNPARTVLEQLYAS